MLFMLFSLAFSARAQQGHVPNGGSYNRWGFWNELYLLGNIKGKWNYQIEFHYRRQGDASWTKQTPSFDPGKNNYQHMYRPWIHYQAKPWLRLSVSPAAYTASWTAPAETKVRYYQPEWRTSLQAMLTHRWGRVQIDHRFRYEYRWYGFKEDNTGYSEFDYSQGNDFPDYSETAPNGTHALQKERMRYMLRVIVPFGKHQRLEPNTWYLITWNELYAGFGPNVTKYEWLDQNRFFFLFGYKTPTRVPMRWEIGYGSRTVPRYTIKNDQVSYWCVEQNNILQLYLWFEDFNALFRRRK